MVEAAGQLIRLFRDGLDYAFTRPSALDVGCGASYQSPMGLILVPARLQFRSQQTYESLQGRSEVGPLPTPRRCHTAMR